MSVEQLKDVLKQNLQERGVLNKIKSHLRAEIFKSFNEDDDETVRERKPHVTGEQLLINELIREYLLWSGYHHSLSVFLQETSQPPELGRRYMASELGLQNLHPQEQDLPLIFPVVGVLRKNKERYQKEQMDQLDVISDRNRVDFPSAFNHYTPPSSSSSTLHDQ